LPDAASARETSAAPSNRAVAAAAKCARSMWTTFLKRPETGIWSCREGRAGKIPNWGRSVSTFDGAFAAGSGGDGGEKILFWVQSDLGRPVLSAKIFRFTFDPNHFYIPRHPGPHKGAFRDRHER
jgi:hypothetical protein